MGVVLGGAGAFEALRPSSRASLVGWAPIDAAVDARTQRVFVVNSYMKNTFNRATGSVSVLDATSGRVLRTIPLGRHDYPLVLSCGTLALDTRRGRGFALVANTNGGAMPVRTGVAMFDLRRGTLLRTLRVGRFAQQVVVDEATGRAFVASSNCGAPNATTVVNLCVGVLDTATGRLIRTITDASSPLVVDQQRGRVFVASGNRVSVLDARSGRVLTTISLGTHNYPLVFTPNTLAVDTRRGRGFALIANDVVTARATGSTPAQFTVTTTVILFDTQRDRVLRTLAVNADHSTGVVVDERTGHAFVTGSNCGMPANTVAQRPCLHQHDRHLYRPRAAYSDGTRRPVGRGHTPWARLRRGPRRRGCARYADRARCVAPWLRGPTEPRGRSIGH